MATIHDIAKRAGVSTATVSRYLNSSGYVSRETGKEIDLACSELGYSVKKYKRRDKHGDRSNVIGVIFAEYDNCFFANAIKAIEKIADEHGKEVIICDSRERPEVEIRNIETLKTRVGGLIIVPVSQMVSYNATYLKEINDMRMPVVLLDRDITEAHLDGVFVDGYSGAYEGLSGLVAQGHKNIAILSGPTTSKPGLERLNGYLQVLKDNNIPIREEFILFADFDNEKSYRLTKKLLQRRFTEPVTAIFTANINMGLGALRAIDECGLRVPDDIAFLTFDDFPTFNFHHLNYSVVENPGYHAGEEAALLLISRMDGMRKGKSASTKRVVLTPTLLFRGSEVFPKNKQP